MKKILLHTGFLVCLSFTALAQVTLTGTRYTQNFDQLVSGLPTGWKVQYGATAAQQGTDQPLNPQPASWGTASDGFYNFASADGLNSGSTTTQQNNSTDRALGVRQTAAGGDPGASFLLQLNNTTGFSNFNIQFKIQSLDVSATRSVQWVVDYGLGATPSGYTSVPPIPAQVVTGNSSWGSTLVSAFFSAALNNLNTPVWIRISAIAPSTGSGTRPITAIDDVTLNYNNGTDNNPPLLVNTFPAPNAVNVQVNEVMLAVFDEQIVKGAGNITIKKFSDNSVAQTINVNSTTVSVANGALAFDPSPWLDTNTVYYINMDAGVVKDLAGHPFAGIGDNSTWKFTTTPFGPPIYLFDLNNCTGALPVRVTRFNTTGDSLWNCTSFGHNNTNGVQINGFNNGDNEDWLILPRLNLTGMGIPMLNFKCRTKFTGPQLTLLVSTNYSGTGNPNAATWTELNGDFPNVNTDTWDTANFADLTNWRTAATSIAWKYTSSTAAGASRWTIDDIVVFNSPIPYVAQVYTNPVYLDMGYTPAGSVSPVKTFRFNASNFNNPLTVKGVNGFELSKDGILFTDTSLIYSPSELLQGGKTVSVRFKPAVADTVYSGSIVFTNSNFVWARKPFLTATSANPVRTLEVVNWNIEWFGSPSNGPTDDNQQEANVRTAMRYLDADIYAFQEIVDTLRFKRLADSMGANYAYKIAYYCSGATSATSGNYNSGQKLGIIYNKILLPQLDARPFMATSPSANTNWATGRFPYQVTGNLILDGQNKPIELYVLHGKAGATNSDYQRRKDGAKEFKDSLDAAHPNANIFIVGDFNDDLDYSILGGVTPSSYEEIVKDSTDDNHYRSVSLALSKQGVSSTLSFPEVIDHQVVSNEVAPWYIGSSMALRTDVALVVPGFLTGNTTDHYPVYGRYLIRNIVTGIRPVPQTLTGVTVFPNPARNRVIIKMQAELGNVHVALFDVTGKILFRNDYLGTNTVQQYTVNLPSLLRGVYCLKITNRNKMATKTIVIE